MASHLFQKKPDVNNQQMACHTGGDLRTSGHINKATLNCQFVAKVGVFSSLSLNHSIMLQLAVVRVPGERLQLNWHQRYSESHQIL